jgi:hypothetical protein
MGTGGIGLAHGAIGDWARMETYVSAHYPLNQFELFQTISKSNSISFKLDLIQTGHSPAPKITIKYGCEGFDVRNNFPYRTVFRFEMDFELKIREASRVWISMEIDGISLGTSRFDEKLGKRLLFAPRWHINSWKGSWSFNLWVSWFT